MGFNGLTSYGLKFTIFRITISIFLLFLWNAHIGNIIFDQLLDTVYTETLLNLIYIGFKKT